MRNYFADIERLLPHNADRNLLRWVQQQKRALSTLIFSPLGIDLETGASLWRVGNDSRQVDFAARSAGVAMIHAIVSAGPGGLETVSIVPPGASSGSAAVRRAVIRGRLEIERHCAELGRELQKIEIGHQVVRYKRTAGSPTIKTTGTRNELVTTAKETLALRYDQ